MNQIASSDHKASLFGQELSLYLLRTESIQSIFVHNRQVENSYRCYVSSGFRYPTLHIIFHFHFLDLLFNATTFLFVCNLFDLTD